MNQNSGHVTTTMTGSVEDQYQNFQYFHIQEITPGETNIIYYRVAHIYLIQEVPR